MLRWQIIATAALSLVAGILWDQDGALSAALGGAVNIVAGSAYGWIAARSSKASAGDALRTMFRAEAVKVLLIIILLWLVFTNYSSIVHAAFLASFAITVAIFAAAIAVRDTDDNKGPRATGEQ